MYYSYHNKVKQLIATGHLVDYEYLARHNAIAPALVLYFDNHSPMPIRQYRWSEYEYILPSKQQLALDSDWD